MARGKAEDAGGLTPAKDGNAALCHFDRRTLPIFICFDYIIRAPLSGRAQTPGGNSIPAGGLPCSGERSLPAASAARPGARQKPKTTGAFCATSAYRPSMISAFSQVRTAMGTASSNAGTSHFASTNVARWAAPPKD